MGAFVVAIIHTLLCVLAQTQEFNLLFREFHGLTTDVNSRLSPCFYNSF
jgi:hypothetical protein